DVEYRREPAGWTLRLFIDKPGGVTLDDCQRVSHEVGTVLEVEDPIPHRFRLEVSSPGLDRPLKSDSDFLEAVGKKVRVIAREPISGQRNFTGRLVRAERAPASIEPGQEGAGLTLRLVDDTGVEREIPAGAVERARIVFEWPQAGGRTKTGGRAGRKR
ncbi:MAG TPA: ribosome maturation factor RimP, partial [Vicinamibacteria bacterium]|nr:ribosome maturation factor RimP [Vicinamibacteria bacterium]